MMLTAKLPLQSETDWTVRIWDSGWIKSKPFVYYQYEDNDGFGMKREYPNVIQSLPEGFEFEDG